MDNNLNRILIGNGAVVFLIAMLVGFYYAIAILDGTELENAFRVAHSGTMAQGLLLIAMGSGLNYLNFKYSTKKIISWLLIITAWGNTIGYNVAAFSGSRGLTYQDTAHGFGLVNKFIFFSFMVAVITILVALIFIIVGAFKKETK